MCHGTVRNFVLRKLNRLCEKWVRARLCETWVRARNQPERQIKQWENSIAVRVSDVNEKMSLCGQLRWLCFLKFESLLTTTVRDCLSSFGTRRDGRLFFLPFLRVPTMGFCILRTIHHFFSSMIHLESQLKMVQTNTEALDSFDRVLLISTSES